MILARRLSYVLPVLTLFAIFLVSDRHSRIMAESGISPAVERISDYDISVVYQADGHRLLGNERAVWTNPGDLPVNELYFHLYPNAFRSKDSTFMKERKPSGSWSPSEQGQMDIRSLKTAAGEDLLPRANFVQPDDGNPADQTLLRVPLTRPILPGASLGIDVQFSVELPRLTRRMGYSQDFIMAGQWFPKLAVYEPAGTRGRTKAGWDLHQYHAFSEFYADFGRYDVRITVPSGYQVAATGKPTGQTNKPEGMEFRFAAKDVHDFAWAASPHFIGWEQPVEVGLNRTVTVKYYADPAAVPYRDRYFRAAQSALQDMDKRIGPYPYDTLSVVIPPEHAKGAGAMEYPTLVTADAASAAIPGMRLERVLVHEVAHQYWYGVIANNEFEEAWLDEGFASYTEDRVIENEYGEGHYHKPVEFVFDAISQNCWNFTSRESYEENVYFRAKTILETVEAKVGRKKMDEILRSYYDRWKFKHPSGDDFRRTVEQVTGGEWKVFFDERLYTKQAFDMEVREPDQGGGSNAAAVTSKEPPSQPDSADEANHTPIHGVPGIQALPAIPGEETSLDPVDGKRAADPLPGEQGEEGPEDELQTVEGGESYGSRVRIDLE